MDVISENYELNEQEKSESESDKNISIEDKCFYLIKSRASTAKKANDENEKNEA